MEQRFIQPKLPDSTAQPVRILIAEDNPTNQLIVRDYLQRSGFQCEVVSNGAAAVKAVLKNSYDLVLMDCEMPGMDGVQATQLIRCAEEAGQLAGHLPIIALTAGAASEDRETCLAAGMDAYLNKPVDLKQLVDVVHLYIQIKAEPAVHICPPATTTTKIAAGSFDFAALLERCLGDVQLLSDMIQHFQTQAATDLAAIDVALAASDGDALRRSAHSLKGAADYLAVRPLREAAAGVEKMAKENQLADAANAAIELHRRVNECVGELNRARQQVTP